ncbi:alpha-1B-glycoprotein-like [Hemicordylus capensis]|uniref:alpha-1B-glycoprotein-like n=1 Tax=Hemicordylus capensis TaxID=884348 RepID=UPI002303ACAA|nr:alpha-1B-glycoprotein-like [Hemicordylus capensis]
MWLSGLEIWSQQSNLVSVAMRESPPPPTLSLNPYHPVYIQGEWITLTCSTPEGLEISGYTFSKEFQGQRSEHSKIKVPLEAFSVGEDTAGNYSCMYWTRLSGREVQSAWSSLISVTMAYPPPAPVLKVDPASRVVTEGAFLVFTCLANGNNTGRKFHFYKDGANISSTTEGLQGSKGEPGDASPDFTLSILKSKPHHTGEFACSYEEEMEGRWVSSSWSPMTILTALALI